VTAVLRADRLPIHHPPGAALVVVRRDGQQALNG
jgi:hypothetical protein